MTAHCGTCVKKFGDFGREVQILIPIRAHVFIGPIVFRFASQQLRVSDKLCAKRKKENRSCPAGPHTLSPHLGPTFTPCVTNQPRPRVSTMPSSSAMPFSSADARSHVLCVLLMLVAAAAPTYVGASTVVSGCTGAASATESNGFFTLSGSSVSGANGCYAMNYDDGEASPGSTCNDACALAGLACTGSTVDSSTADCSAAVDWYLQSSAKQGAIPASPAAGSHAYCGLQNFFGGGWQRATAPMPSQRDVACTSRRFQGPALHVAPCKCDDPVVDTTAPALSSIVASQASPSSVTVTGGVDEASTVYCAIGASGDTHTPAGVKAAGFTDVVGSAGTFSVAVTGVSGDGTKSVACVGEDAAGNLGSTVSSGADFHFGTPWHHVVRCSAQSCRAHRAI